MSIFGSSTMTNGYHEVPVIEGYTVENNGDLIALGESQRDYHNIIKSIHALEITRMQATTESANGEDFEVVTEGMVKDTLEKIKKFFKELAGKVKAFLASLVMAFDALVKNGADFAKKYENALKKRDLKGLEVRIHTYTNLDFTPIDKVDQKVSDYVTEILDKTLQEVASTTSKEKLEKYKEDLESIDKEATINRARGEMIGSGPLTADEFGEALYAHFRNGAQSKTEAPEGEVKIEAIIANLKDSKPAKDAKALKGKYSTRMDQISKATDRVADNIQKAVENTEGNKHASFKHGDKDHSLNQNVANAAIAGLRESASLTQANKTIGLAAIRALKTAISERTRVSKAICLRAATYKPEKK